MRILHLCGGNYYKEGMGYQENLLSQMHKQMGYEVSILARAQIPDESGELVYADKDYVNTAGIPVKILKLRQSRCRILFKLYRAAKLYNGLYQQITELQPDIIFIHGGQFISLNDVRRYVKKHMEVRLYIDQHMDYYNQTHNAPLMDIINQLHGMELRKLSKYVNKFWGTTPWRCQYLHEVYHLPLEKIDLLVMGGDDNRIQHIDQKKNRKEMRDHLKLKDDDFVVVTGGRIDSTKNIHRLMDAVIAIGDPRLKLVVFGNIFPEIKDQIEPKIENPSIRYVGWIPSEKVYDYFLASDLAAFPGTHSVLWEQACACGLPCIFNDWQGMHHVDLGGNCMFVNGADTAQLEDSIRKLLNNHGQYEKMKAVAKSKCVSEFSYSEIAKRAIEIED